MYYFYFPLNNLKTKMTGMTAHTLEEQDAIVRKSLEENDRKSDLLNPVCCFTVTTDSPHTNEKSVTNFPPAISVIVDPPSPSMSIDSQHDPPGTGRLETHLRRHSGGSMERRKKTFFSIYKQYINKPIKRTRWLSGVFVICMGLHIVSYSERGTAGCWIFTAGDSSHKQRKFAQSFGSRFTGGYRGAIRRFEYELATRSVKVCRQNRGRQEIAHYQSSRSIANVAE